MSNKKPLINRIDKNKCMNIIDIIEDDDEKYIFLSEIFLQKDMVIKVMKHLYNRSFVDIYKNLQNHDYFNIIPFYGFTKCRDDFKQIKLKYMTEGLCTEKDYDKIYLLVMKHINMNHVKCSKIQLASAFFQIIITSLILYKETGIIHTDIKKVNYAINFSTKEKEMYHASPPSITVIINLLGVKVDIIDYDNAIIEEDSMKTHLFVSDIRNTCKNFFSLYTIIPNDIYLKLDNELKEYEKILKISGTQKQGVIKRVYKMIMTHVYPLFGEEVMKVIDL